MMARTSFCLAIAGALVLCGCIKGPNYSRPKVDVPDAYHGPDNAAAAASAESLGNARWWTVFEDQELQKLIRVALADSFDVRIAATRVLQATESVAIARSYQYPTLSGGIIVAGQRTPTSSGGANTYNIPELGVSGS